MIIGTKLKEGVPHCVDLRNEVLMGHGHLPGLVAALLCVGDLVRDRESRKDSRIESTHLVFHLDASRSSLNHLLGKQVGRLLVAKASINVRNDGHDVGLEVVNLGHQGLFFRHVLLLPRLVQGSEELVKLPGISLPQEGVDLPNEGRHSGLLVHRLVGKGAELRPGGEIIIQFLTVLKT